MLLKAERIIMYIPVSRWLLAALVASTALLAACGSDSAKIGEDTAPRAAMVAQPEYYPADYGQLVDGSRNESGLLIYSNVAEYNWRDIIRGFNQKYPWIKVSTLDLGPGEIFERYYSEVSAKQKTSDLIVNAAPDAWLRFMSKDGIEPYLSAEDSKLPGWSKPVPGLYTASTDPLVIIYNKMLLKDLDPPTSLTQLSEMMIANPARFGNKVTTYDATSHSFAYALHWAVVNSGKLDGWDLFEKIGPLTQPESGGANMLDKVTSGEYLAAYYTSGATTFSQLSQGGRDRVVGWELPRDGTPVIMRGLAIPRGARSPLSARLMLDYLVSHEGQVAMGKGGMTPYRPDVKSEEVSFLTYADIVEKVGGTQNVILVNYAPAMLTEYKPFIERWGALFKEKK